MKLAIYFKAIILVFLLISITPDSDGQILNIENYQKEINNAELSIVSGNKEEALNTYIEILNQSKGNFCKDIYNALLLSDELSN